MNALDWARLHQQLSIAVGKIGESFAPECKLTLLVRTPSVPNGDADILLTEDDLDEVIAALQIRKAAE